MKSCLPGPQCPGGSGGRGGGGRRRANRIALDIIVTRLRNISISGGGSIVSRPTTSVRSKKGIKKEIPYLTLPACLPKSVH